MIDYLYLEETPIVPILSLTAKREAQIITNHALDGSVYIHNVGPSRMVANVYVLAKTYEERSVMDQIVAEGHKVSCHRGTETFIGYIEGDIEWRVGRDGWSGVGNFTLLVDMA